MITITDKIISPTLQNSLKYSLPSEPTPFASPSKSFLSQVARIVNENASSQQQQMSPRKRDYSSRKKDKDLHDERDNLLGKVRRLELQLHE
jgi:hypothetical protein